MVNGKSCSLYPQKRDLRVKSSWEVQIKLRVSVRGRNGVNGLTPPGCQLKDTSMQSTLHCVVRFELFRLPFPLRTRRYTCQIGFCTTPSRSHRPVQILPYVVVPDARASCQAEKSLLFHFLKDCLDYSFSFLGITKKKPRECCAAYRQRYASADPSSGSVL